MTTREEQIAQLALQSTISGTTVNPPMQTELAVYSPTELHHLGDVSALIRGVERVAWAALLFTAVAVWVDVRHRGVDASVRAVRAGAQAVLTALVLLAMLMGLAWSTGFRWFHEILFPAGNYRFEADSALIRHFPPGYFQFSSALMALVVAGAAGGVWCATRTPLLRRHACRSLHGR